MSKQSAPETTSWLSGMRQDADSAKRDADFLRDSRKKLQEETKKLQEETEMLQKRRSELLQMRSQLLKKKSEILKDKEASDVGLRVGPQRIQRSSRQRTMWAASASSSRRRGSLGIIQMGSPLRRSAGSSASR